MRLQGPPENALLNTRLSQNRDELDFREHQVQQYVEFVHAQALATCDMSYVPLSSAISGIRTISQDAAPPRGPWCFLYGGIHIKGLTSNILLAI